MPAERPASATWAELSGWGRRPRSGAWVRAVRDAADVPADPPARGLLPRGLGRSYGDAALNAGGLVLDMTPWRGVRSFDTATGRLTAAAGTSLDEVIRAALPHGWFPAVVPGTRWVTLGGAVAADVHGKNHHSDGGFARHVATLVLQPPGEEPSTVTPDTDVFRATAGGMGLTGVIWEVTLRLARVETAWVQVDTERASDLDDVMARMVDRDHAYRHSVAWVDLLTRGGGTGRGVLTRGNLAPVDALPPHRRGQALGVPPDRHVTVPDVLPSGLLSRPAIRAFNEAWFHAGRPGSSLQHAARFFFPLDRVGWWNRLYGRRGFLQYQIAVPEGAEETLRTVVRRLADAGCPSFLSVLKRFGDGGSMLSFPLRGWTLSADVPVGWDGLGPLLDGLDEDVAAAGGRVYLAKDGRMRPEVFRAMYPDLPRWLAVRQRLDPAGALRSDLARRLELA